MRKKGPKILFLMKTKLSVSEMKPIQQELQFDSMTEIPRVIRSGGIALLWKNEVPLTTYTISPNHIDVVITTSMQVQWQLTGVYGHPKDQIKCETWYLMRHLNNQASLPWVCVRDFNEILSSTEKKGGFQNP